MAYVSAFEVTAYCLQTVAHSAVTPVESAAMGFIALSSALVMYGALTGYLISVITGPMEMLARQEPLTAYALAIVLTYYLAILADSFRRSGMGSICVNADFARILAGIASISHIKGSHTTQTSHILAPHWVPGTSPRITYQ